MLRLEKTTTMIPTWTGVEQYSRRYILRFLLPVRLPGFILIVSTRERCQKFKIWSAIFERHGKLAILRPFHRVFCTERCKAYR